MAVMPAGDASMAGIEISMDDVDVSWFSGTGPGGQNRNKVQACCRLRHRSTGVTSVAQMRSRNLSLSQALEDLRQKVNDLARKHAADTGQQERLSQIGSGQRGDKVRTIQFQNDQAVDHRNGRKISALQYMKGHMDRLW